MPAQDSPGSSSSIADFLSFRRMVTPIVIQVFFWLGVAAILLFAAIIFIAALTGPGGRHAGAPEVIGGLCAMVFLVPLSLLLWRVYCEVLMLLFRMNETLVDIRNGLEQKSVPPI